MSRPRISYLLHGATFLWAIGLFSSPAHAIPAFARKYGLRCPACHEAWPMLNDFGRTFRDNGYQLLLGHDEPTTNPPGYWPVSARLTPRYEFVSTSNQITDQGKKTLQAGGIGDIGMDLLLGGTLAKNVSFLVVPTGFTSQDGVTLESAWVRFDNLLGSSWLNVKLGMHEVDLPRSAHRSWNLTDTGYLIYSYHPAGSLSLYDMGENQRGIEIVGHDRGSHNRVAFSAFNVEGSPGSRNGFDTPGFYLHATHESQFDSDLLSALKVGMFVSYTTWPTTFLTSGGEPIDGTGGNLKSASKFGLEGHFWLGPAATPFHAILLAVHGQDDRDLIPGATRDGTFNGGFLEIGYTPRIKSTYFARYDLIRNSTQAVPGVAKDFNDQTAYTLGVRYTCYYSDTAEVALHGEYSIADTKGGAGDGSDVRFGRGLLGVDFAF
jgi:hypothetical protein